MRTRLTSGMEVSPIARNCNCGSGGCQCRIVAGPGVAITGSGTVADPITVSTTFDNLTGLIYVQPTPTVAMNMVGSGAFDDPFVISANATVRMLDLTDVTPGEVPSNGDVPVFNASTGLFELAPPPTTPPGAVSVSAGLLGDGSGPNPLRVAVSDLVTTSPLGLATYIDTSGLLRAKPYSFDQIPDLPAYFPSRWSLVIEKPTVFPPIIGTTSTTAAAGNHTHAISSLTGTATISQIPTGTTSSTVALGNHTHAISSLSGTATISQLPTGTTSNTVAIGNHTHSSFSGLTVSGTLNATGTVNATTVNVSGTLTGTSGIFVAGVTVSPGSSEFTNSLLRHASTYGNAVAGARDVIVTSGGTFGTTASALKFKEDVEPLESTPVLLLDPVTYHMKSETIGTRETGVIADQALEIGLDDLVWFDDEGEVHGFDYKRLSVHLLAALRAQDARLADLEATIAEAREN